MLRSYRIYFPLFDHIEAKSNEVRLTLEGLQAHPRVTLVDQPEEADFVIFCQNHLVGHNPFHTRFLPIKDKYKERTILLDYDDNPRYVFDVGDFRWRLYFKRSLVDREQGRPMEYPGFRIIPTAYCLVDDMVQPPADWDKERRIDVSCLFDDWVEECPWYHRGRGRLLRFARRLSIDHGFNMQIGTVSDSGPAGRAAINPRYKRCLYDSKIVLHANPDPWEGDARTWEALGAGALVFVDRMFAPIRNPLVDGRHLVFYDLTEEGLCELEKKVLYYLGNERERSAIGNRGREFVLKHHRSIDRVNAVIAELDREDPQSPRG